MTRMRSSWPRSASRFRTGRTSICEPGQERAHADVDRQAALDPLDDAADDDLALGVGLLDLVPDLHLLGFFAREDDVAFAIFGALEQDVDDVARLDGDLAVLVEELADLDDAFGLVADVDDHFGRGDLENRPLDDLAFRDVPEAAIVGIEQPCVLFRIDLLVVLAWSGFEPAAIAGFTVACALGTFDSAGAAAATRTWGVLVFYVRMPCASSCADLEIPISNRAYDTYRQTVKVPKG
jgi:hypothetical protein